MLLRRSAPLFRRVARPFSSGLNNQDKKPTETNHIALATPHVMIYDPVTNYMPHPIYKSSEVEKVDITHVKPKGIRNRIAYSMVKVFRFFFDLSTGYKKEGMSELLWFRRVIFLETVAGVPGFAGGMCRHLRSLRSLKHDKGWINHLLAEAENERKHLMVFMHERNPGKMFRLLIVGAQGIFMNVYFICYVLSPKTCHRFVGYLEEEAVKTYTHMLHDIDHGSLTDWGTKPAPMEAKQYWQLDDNATWRDVVLAIRADESVHRDFNHGLADMNKGNRAMHERVDTKSRFDSVYVGNDKI